MLQISLWFPLNTCVYDSLTSPSVHTASVPDSIKAELLQRIRKFLVSAAL